MPQINATERSERLDDFVESRRQDFREVRLVPVKRHQSKANDRPKSKQQNNRESEGTVAQTGNIVLAKEPSSSVVRKGSDGKLEHERGTSPWKITKVLKRGLDDRSSPELAMYTPKGSNRFTLDRPICAPSPPLADEFAQICMVSGLWTNHPICSSRTPLRSPKRNFGNHRGTHVGIAR